MVRFRPSILDLCGYALLSALLIGAAVLSAQADGPPTNQPKIDETMRNDQAKFLVRAEVNHANGDYREGDNLSIRVSTEEDAYVYVQYQQADGKVFQIFPNSTQPNNKLAARQAVDIPAKDDLFRWQISGPFGKEVVKVIASKQPIKNLSDPNLREKRFNPVTGQQLKGIELELGEEKAEKWAECDVAIHTYQRQQASPATGVRRWGVFFGVSQYEFHGESKESGNERGLNLVVPHRDAQTMGHAMRDVGELNDYKIFTNEQATRRNLEEMITRWLPSVSRPGDTVVIYFSGHGMQIPDDAGDEADGMDECILPHDYVNRRILGVLAQKYLDKKITDPDLGARVEQLALLSKEAGEKGDEALIRSTAVSDDTFAHWLQRLSGRQVVVILDTCYGGGFATTEKGVSAAGQPKSFDFLQGEMTRLKDIGQTDQAMLAAAMAPEVAYERVTQDYSLLTKCLLDYLRNANGPVRLEKAFEFCQPQFTDYFETVNRELKKAGKEPLIPCHPYLVNHCQKPVFLKP